MLRGNTLAGSLFDVRQSMSGDQRLGSSKPHFYCFRQHVTPQFASLPMQ
jgi:hypothetical protein